MCRPAFTGLQCETSIGMFFSPHISLLNSVCIGQELCRSITCVNKGVCNPVPTANNGVDAQCWCINGIENLKIYRKKN